MYQMMKGPPPICCLRWPFCWLHIWAGPCPCSLWTQELAGNKKNVKCLEITKTVMRSECQRLNHVGFQIQYNKYKESQHWLCSTAKGKLSENKIRWSSRCSSLASTQSSATFAHLYYVLYCEVLFSFQMEGGERGGGSKESVWIETVSSKSVSHKNETRWSLKMFKVTGFKDLYMWSLKLLQVTPKLLQALRIYMCDP